MTSIRELREEAARLEIKGRSKMGKDELQKAIDSRQLDLDAIEKVNRSAEALERVDEILHPNTHYAPALIEAPAAENVNLPAATKELIVQINPDATASELEVFFYQCARTGLDPIANQIYLVRRSNRMVIQTGIDGYRLVASRSGLMAGSDDPEFTEKDDMPDTATVTVYRIAADGERYGYTATARWSEYAPADLDDKSSFMWKKMPHTMLGKCAEALALRKAFPNELSGLYTDVEMAQAGAADSGPRPELKVSDRYFCPACEKAGKQVPAVDNIETHRNPAEGKKAQPAWKCSAGKNCAEGSNWGWGVWDVGYFDDQETGGDLTVGRPSMAGIFKITDSPADAVRKWLFVKFKGDANETKLFWTAVVEHDSQVEVWAAGDMTQEEALGIEERMNEVLDEWEEPFDG